MTPGEKQRYGDVFRTAYLFRNLPPEDLSIFMDSAELRSFARDAAIIAEGADGGDLFLVLSGCVRITKTVEDAGDHIIGFLRAGDFFGEMALIDNLPRSASVYAHERADLAVIHRRDISRIFDASQATACKVMHAFAEILSYRLREANDRMRAMVHLERTF